jgi:hypothetical protein
MRYKILHLATGEYLKIPGCWGLEDIKEAFTDDSTFFVYFPEKESNICLCKGVLGQIAPTTNIPKYQFEIVEG